MEPEIIIIRLNLIALAFTVCTIWLYCSTYKSHKRFKRWARKDNELFDQFFIEWQKQNFERCTEIHKELKKNLAKYKQGL